MAHYSSARKAFHVAALVACIITIVFLGWWVLRSVSGEGFETVTTTSEAVAPFPKKIWSYWDGDNNEVINRCVKTWSKFNPDYKIVMLNRANLAQYLPDEDLSVKPWEGYDYTPQRFSDMVRLHILRQEGGFWMDATIVCHASLDWIQQIRRDTGCNFVGYYIDQFTNENRRDTSPTLESWFFACTQGCEFVRDWCNEFRTIVDYDTIDLYLDEVRKTTDFSTIPNATYLTIHVSAQKLMQNRKTKDDYGMVLLRAEDTAFSYLNKNGWDPAKSVNALTRGDFDNQPVIKMRGCERTAMEDEPNRETYFARIT